MTISTSSVHRISNKVINFLLRRRNCTACWSVSYYELDSARRAIQQVGQCKSSEPTGPPGHYHLIRVPFSGFAYDRNKDWLHSAYTTPEEYDEL
jgi:hypothetical protein